MAEEESAPTRRRRGRPAGSATGTRSAPTTRRRRIGGAELVDTLNDMVSQLIKENRSLKRQLAKLSAGGSSAPNGSAERTLRTLQRKVARAVSSAAPTTRRRRAASGAPTTRRRSGRRAAAATE